MVGATLADGWGNVGWLMLVQRWPNEQSNVAPTIVAAVGPTLHQRLAYGWLTVTVLAG